MKTSSSKYDGNIIVVSDRGDIITALKKNEYVYSENIKKIIKRISEKGSAIYNVDGEEYIVSHTKAQNRWKYLSLIPLVYRAERIKNP